MTGGGGAHRGGRPRRRWILGIAVLAILNGSYLAAFDTASIFYHVNVLLHVVLGIPLAVAILFWSLPALFQAARRAGGVQGGLFRVLGVLALVFVGSGLVLTYTGTARPYRAILQLHVWTAIAGGSVLLLIVWLWSRRPGADRKARSVFFWNFVVLGAALALPVATRLVKVWSPPHVIRIVNPESPPMTAFEEGGGPSNPFFPSSNEVVGSRLLPSDFFLDSKRTCGSAGCHPDITRQWESSMHHFSSFNNQWYRKSIEYMQDTIGTEPSKWCGGCHDPAVLLTGRMDEAIVKQIDTPEAQAGIGCLVCHSIVHVKDTMGQGGYVLEYPAMHRLATSESRVMKLLHDTMIRLDPAPHRMTMLKPFHRESGPEFCSTCHKVHLDVPVNSYRWLRGFNEYDPWQSSGVSGQGARAFYYPPQPRTCSNCHMPLEPSDDMGNIEGRVHSHRFPAANTAIPFVNHDEEQLEASRRFLIQNGVTVDIFGVATIGDDASDSGAGVPRLLAPLPDRGEGRAGVTLARGREYLLEVVVRTRNVGHMFPAGTADAFDVWVELKGEDENGRVAFWSGWLAEEMKDGETRKGPVDPAAHFYRSFLLDGNGNHINKRNAWAARAVLYAQAIPPGAADTVHYRVRVPEDAGERLTFTAKVNYRKFSWWNTQWSYAGERDPDQGPYGVSEHHDDGRWVFTGDTSGVSGAMKEIPDLPIIEMAADTVVFEVVDRGAERPADRATDAGGTALARERYNDYGIGLLLQGDLKGAAAAFREVTRIDPEYADGFVNIARAQIEEGDHRSARAMLEKALEIDPDLPKTHYFYAVTLKSEGLYDEAIEHLKRTLESYPGDRVVLNQLGRILFLQRRYDEAITVFKRTLAVDPEDLQAHYNLMLCYRGKGDEESAEREEKLHARFKADETSQELTGSRRRAHPEDNNERQPVHEHRSTWMAGPAAYGETIGQ